MCVISGIPLEEDSEVNVIYGIAECVKIYLVSPVPRFPWVTRNCSEEGRSNCKIDENDATNAQR
jgi:hypothetical protein